MGYTPYVIKKSRLTLQVEEGLTKTGKVAHRSFGVPKIKADAKHEDLMEVVEALRKVIEFPISDAKLVKKEIWPLLGPEVSVEQEEGEETETTTQQKQQQNARQTTRMNVNTMQTSAQTTQAGNIRPVTTMHNVQAEANAVFGSLELGSSSSRSAVFGAEMPVRGKGADSALLNLLLLPQAMQGYSGLPFPVKTVEGISKPSASYSGLPLPVMRETLKNDGVTKQSRPMSQTLIPPAKKNEKPTAKIGAHDKYAVCLSDLYKKPETVAYMGYDPVQHFTPQLYGEAQFF